MRKFLGILIRMIGYLKLPMGLRMMRWLAWFSPDGLVELTCENGGKYIYRVAIDTVFGNGLAFGLPIEPEIERLVDKLTNQDSIVIDVGCNIGTFCIPLSKRIARVVGLDANPEMVRQAEANARLNGITNIEFVVAAVGAEAGFGNFFLNDDRNDISSLSEAWVKQFADSRRIIVPILTLDHLIESLNIKQVDILKIDVENFSGAVIRGLGNAISCIKHIVAEDSEDMPAIMSWLKEAGFDAVQPLKNRTGLPPHSRNTWLFSQVNK